MIFAVLDLQVADVVLKRRFKLLSFFTIILAVFLHDLASVYQMSSKRNYSRQSYDVISISKTLKIVAIWSWKSSPGVGFSNSTRLAMLKSLSKPNFDRIARSTAVLLLLRSRDMER